MAEDDREKPTLTEYLYGLEVDGADGTIDAIEIKSWMDSSILEIDKKTWLVS